MKSKTRTDYWTTYYQKLTSNIQMEGLLEGLGRVKLKPCNDAKVF